MDADLHHNGLRRPHCHGRHLIPVSVSPGYTTTSSPLQQTLLLLLGATLPFALTSVPFSTLFLSLPGISVLPSALLSHSTPRPSFFNPGYCLSSQPEASASLLFPQRTSPPSFYPSPSSENSFLKCSQPQSNFGPLPQFFRINLKTSWSPNLQIPFILLYPAQPFFLRLEFTLSRFCSHPYQIPAHSVLSPGVIITCSVWL